MKKFLSILLAVMMVLSTASFAAPSAFTAMDSAKVEADVVVEEVVAELAAEAGDESTYGNLVFKIDFENLEADETVADNTYVEKLATEYDPALCNNSFRLAIYVAPGSDPDTVLVDSEGNKYLGGARAYSQIRIDNQKYNVGEGQTPEGIYTYVADVINLDATADKSFSCTTQASWVGGVQVNAGITPTMIDTYDDLTNEWDTVSAQWNGSTNDMTLYFSDSAATNVGWDNLRVYYRPATVTLTIDGNEYEVSTDAPVSAASLAKVVKAPVGLVLSGISLTEGGEALTGEQYFFEDTVLYPTYKADDTIDARYGKKIVSFSFDDASRFTTELCNEQYSQFYVSNVADYYDEAHNLSVLQYYVPYTGVPSYENGYSQSSVTAWGSINLVTHSGFTYNEGVYTIAFDLATSATTGFGITQSSSSFTILDDYTFTNADSFDHVVIQVNKDYLAGRNNLQIQFSAAQDILKVDNLEVYYKPNVADVTVVYRGEEYLAEDISTTGVTTASVLAKAGLEVPYGKKAVFSATNGGESVGDTLYLITDSTYYLSFVDDDSISPYGTLVYAVDFEQDDFSLDGFQTAYAKLAEYNIASYKHPEYDFSNVTTYSNAAGDGFSNAELVTEDGNTYIKGDVDAGYDGFIRMTKYNIVWPDGYYTFSVDVKAPAGQVASFAQQCNDTKIPLTQLNAFSVASGDWQTVVNQTTDVVNGSELYGFFVALNNAAAGTVSYDNWKVYYKPATVNLTVDNNGVETVYEDISSTVDVDELLKDVYVPFGYRVGLAAEKNGEPLTGTLSLVSDAKFYVVYTEDTRVDFNYGEALFVIDFERESMQGWDGNSQEINNSVGGNGVFVCQSASYYDPRFENANYRVRFVINESGENLIDQKIVEGADGNHYTTGTNTTKYPQVVSTNWGNVQGDAGVYTFMYDVKVEETTETSLGMTHAALHGGAATVVDGFSAAAGEWDTVVLQVIMDAAGNIPKGTWGNFNFGANNTTTLSFDNARLYFKPLTATVDVVANGEVVKTVTNVSTETGVTVAKLVEDVKLKGYKITGASFGGNTYSVEDTVIVPCDCSVELILEVQEIDPATPETLDDEKALRTGDASGLRFKAKLAKSELERVTGYGWIVTRESLLTDAGITSANFTKDSNVKKSMGYNYGSGTEVAKIFESDDTSISFTAVLYFANVDSDNLPSVEKLADKLVARPFAVVDGEYLYGDPTTPASIFDIAWDFYVNNSDDMGEWNGDVDAELAAYCESVIYKVGIPE